MVFDIICYAIATASVLALFGGRKAPATRPARQVESTIATLHAIGEALPSADECFAVEAIAEEISTIVEVGSFDCGNATAEESALVDAAEVAIALYWDARPTCNVVPFRRPSAHPALEGLGIRELKKLASAAKVRKYSNLTKAQLIQALRAA